MLCSEKPRSQLTVKSWLTPGVGSASILNMKNRVYTVVRVLDHEGVQLYGMFPSWKPFCDLVAEIFGTGYSGVSQKKLDERDWNDLPECMKEGVDHAYLIHFDDEKANRANAGYYILESKPIETWYG